MKYNAHSHEITSNIYSTIHNALRSNHHFSRYIKRFTNVSPIEISYDFRCTVRPSNDRVRYAALFLSYLRNKVISVRMI